MPRILIIDPDPFNCRRLKETLSNAGYFVDSASNGKLALKELQEQRVHLVITEMVMPEMDGVEIIQTLRRDYPKIKLLALCGDGIVSADRYLRLARTLGAHQVVAKPYTQEEILYAVINVLADQGSDIK
jgi:CheY-like chemotaxis protein